jgi:soluble lytic murein transglycosylase
MRSRAGQGLAAVALAFAICGVKAAAAATPTSVTLRADAAGAHVAWTLAPPADAAGTRADPPADPDRWTTRLFAPDGAATALHVLGAGRFAAGDSAGADSCWRTLAGRRGPWQVDALLRHAGIAQARSGAAAAERLLAAAEPTDVTDSESASLLGRRAALRTAAGDAGGAEVLARELVRAYPAVAPYAGRALALLDSLAGARGDSLGVDDLRAGVEVDVYRGARSAAVGKLRRVIARTERARRFGPTLRLTQVLREMRMPLAAGAAADSLAALAAGPGEQVVAALEQARTRRDAGATEEALARYARVGRGTSDSETRSTAWWEYAREAQDRTRYRDALEGFARASQLGGRRADDARFQAGLVHFALGDADSARSWWRRAHGEGARFWLAISLRGSDRAASDSLLSTLAELPGYAFHRAAARETLGTAGWAGRPVALAPAAGDEPAVADDVRALLAGGRQADAALLLGRWLARDARVATPGERETGPLLAGAALAFEAGRPALGTRFAEAAFAAARSDSEAWAVVPWAYPPAYETLVVAAETLGVERALTWALVRQESRFDPLARSRSDALGLTQLMPAAAQDAARMLHEHSPSEDALFDPARSLRFGMRYLAQLLRRFDGSLSVALVAYNAGPATVRRDWREIVARGGDALFCELASNADSQDYARRISGFRSAYRELRPSGRR